MKNRFFLLLTTITLLSFRSDETKDYLNVQGPLSFDNKTFNLKWSQKNGNYYIQEYLIAGETLDNFNEMISLFVLNENVSIEDAIAVKKQELDNFKKTDPVCNYAVTSNTNDKTVLIDFLRGESEGEAMTVVEFNLYRYKQIKIGKNKNAVLVYAFSKRAYGSEITPFLKSLTEERLEYLIKIFSVEIPEIKLVN